MAAPDNKKKKCQTVIPKDWPKFTGPALNGHNVAEANAAWRAHVRNVMRLGPNPRVYRRADTP